METDLHNLYKEEGQDAHRENVKKINVSEEEKQREQQQDRKIERTRGKNVLLQSLVV